MRPPILSQIAQRLLTHGPKIVAKPLAFIPFNLKAQILNQILTPLFNEQAQDDELLFLQDRWVRVTVADMQLDFEVSFNQGWQIREPLSRENQCYENQCNELQSSEVTFTANSQELIMIAAGKEDPDTLFFQRKLAIEGDTALGLEVKNLLLSVELDSLPSPIKSSLAALVMLLEQLKQQAELAHPAKNH